MRAAAIRHHQGLDATRVLIPLGQKTWAQLIGSRARFAFKAIDIRGWDVALVHNIALRHAFNPQSLVELWLETDMGESIYCIGKFIQQQTPDTCIILLSAGGTMLQSSPAGYNYCCHEDLHPFFSLPPFLLFTSRPLGSDC